MKKFTILTIVICLFFLSTCKKDMLDTTKDIQNQPNISENPQDLPNTTEEHLQNPNYNSITFRVNDSFPEYNATITYNLKNSRLAETLIIVEKESGAPIQKITLPENDCFTKEPLYLLDITFDGNLDILVPAENPASAVYFQAYVWNEKECQFIYAPTFENLSNIALDIENKLILSSRSASRITYYNMSYYDMIKNDFIIKNSFYMEPTEDEQSLHFVEKELQNAELKIIIEDTIAVDNPYSPDETNPSISHYFKTNSFWDLNSLKWKSYFLYILNFK